MYYLCISGIMDERYNFFRELIVSSCDWNCNESFSDNFMFDIAVYLDRLHPRDKSSRETFRILLSFKPIALATSNAS